MFAGWDGINEGGGDRLLKKKSTKPNVRMVSKAGMKNEWKGAIGDRLLKKNNTKSNLCWNHDPTL